jgi:hypothetical protein
MGFRQLAFVVLSLALARGQVSAQSYVYVATDGIATEHTLLQIAFTPRIAVLETATGNVISSIPMPACTPVDLAFKPDGSRLLAACSSLLLSIDPAAGQIVATAAFSSVGSLRLTPDGGTGMFVDTPGNAVVFFDTATLAATKRVTLPSPQSLDLSGNGARAYVVVQGTTNQVVVLDVATGDQVGAIPVGQFPRDIAVSSTGNRAVVTHGGGSPFATIIDTAANTARAQVFPAAGIPTFTPISLRRPVVDAGGARAFVPIVVGDPTEAGVRVIDLSSNTVTGRLPGTNAGPAALSPGGQRLYVGAASSEFSRIAVIDPSGGGTLLGTVAIAGATQALAVAPSKVFPPTDACSYSIARVIPLHVGSISRPPSDPRGSSGSIGVTALPDRCPWSPSADVPWITFDAAGGVGIATVGYTVAPNTAGMPRTGSVQIGGQILTFVQDGCSDPVAVVDTPKPGQTVAQPYRVGGWVIDRCASSGTGISGMFMQGKFAGGYGTARPDIAALFGPQFLNSGFEALVSYEELPTFVPQPFMTFGVTSTNTSISAQVDNVTILPATRPFGVIDTPGENTTASGELPLTGWALDDVGLSGAINVYRDPVPGEPVPGPGGRIFIGAATRVQGSRPDVAAAFPTMPQNDRAGFGLMILSNVLPNGGNGTFRFTIDVSDTRGTTTLGPRAVNVDNRTSQVPFGTIDTPGQGATVSGTAVNFGWVLASSGNVIPTDGSTIDVVVDGRVAGHPVYNQFRSDIANAFPASANANGAVGYFLLDTKPLTNGVHTIGWVARDAAGHTAGLGSRFFTVANP